MKIAVEWYEKALELIHDPELERKIPQLPSEEELNDNPRSRSAKLRVAEKI